MKFKEFAEEVQRTCPTLYSDINGTPNFIFDTLHMRLGIVSEIEELMLAIHNKDKVNVGEELADILWYVANDIRIKHRRTHIGLVDMTFMFSYEFNKGIQVTDGGYLTTSEGINAQFNALIYNAAKLADYAKKDLAYGKPESDNYIKIMNYLLGAVNNLGIHLKIDLEEYMQKVVDKLKARYPEKFTADNAINRDLTKEREILEKGIDDTIVEQ